MKEGFRQCMAWLHTWTGLVVGWILLFVFVTGTASYANREITRWMQPEQPIRVSNAPGNAEQFDIAYRHLLANPASHQSSSWTIDFINTGRTGNQLTANWSLPPEPGQNRGRTEGVTLDAVTGEIVEPGEQPRATAGGRALVRMHYALHYIPFDWAIRIVGICTMIMLIAIVTGIITHKKIFKDFFTFRGAKGQRSWLDAHNAVGVIALPFYLMITYSGLLFFMYAYMPLGVPLTYGFEAEDQQAYYTELSSQVGSTRLVGRTVGGGGGGRGANTTPADAAEPSGDDTTVDAPGREGQRERTGMERSGVSERNQSERNERNAGGERPDTRPAERAGRGNGTGGENQGRNQEGRNQETRNQGRNQEPAAINPVRRQTAEFADLSAIVRQVESEWGKQEIRAVTITAASQSAPARLQLARANIDTIRGRGTNAQYNAITGERIAPSNQDTPATDVFGRAMLGLHEGQFARPLTRWLYVISGILGSAMIATGLVLWTVKRRPKQATGNAWNFGHTLVEKLNVTAVAGLPFALALYFWSNRLLPLTLEDRAAWEINSMFIAWLLILIHALFRPVMQAWREVLLLTAAAYLLLPALNFITTDRHLLVTVSSGDWILVSIEAVFIGLGLMFAWAGWKIHLRMGAEKRRPAEARAIDQDIAPDDLAKGHA